VHVAINGRPTRVCVNEVEGKKAIRKVTEVRKWLKYASAGFDIIMALGPYVEPHIYQP
jgi:hypothetical protein